MPVDGEKGVMVFMNVLNIEHVSKIFGDKKIFDDISYGIHDGDMTIIQFGFYSLA